MENPVNEEVKTKRQMLDERLKNRYPDKDFSDEESFYGQISDDYDDYDKRIEGYEERERKITDMFAKDPRSAAFLSDWHNGEDPEIAMIRRHGEENFRAALDDPEKLDAIAEANKEYVERVAKEKELEEKYKANIQESLQLLEKMKEEKGLDDEQMDAAVDFLIAIGNDAILGKFSAENLELALKALNYDKDVAEAAEEAEVRGKNAKIEEKLRKRESGDGIPALSGKPGGAMEQPKASSIFDVARGAQ